MLSVPEKGGVYAGDSCRGRLPGRGGCGLVLEGGNDEIRIITVRRLYLLGSCCEPGTALVCKMNSFHLQDGAIMTPIF